MSLENQQFPTPDKNPDSPAEKYQDLLQELAALDGAHYASVDPRIVEQMKQNKLQAIDDLKKKFPQLNN